LLFQHGRLGERLGGGAMGLAHHLDEGQGDRNNDRAEHQPEDAEDLEPTERLGNVKLLRVRQQMHKGFPAGHC
jgi:hypothetical protein